MVESPLESVCDDRGRGACLGEPLQRSARQATIIARTAVGKHFDEETAPYAEGVTDGVDESSQIAAKTRSRLARRNDCNSPAIARFGKSMRTAVTLRATSALSATMVDMQILALRVRTEWGKSVPCVRRGRTTGAAAVTR